MLHTGVASGQTSPGDPGPEKTKPSPGMFRDTTADMTGTSDGRSPAGGAQKLRTLARAGEASAGRLARARMSIVVDSGISKTPSPFARTWRIRPTVGVLVTRMERVKTACVHGLPPRVRGIPARASRWRRNGGADCSKVKLRVDIAAGNAWRADDCRVFDDTREPSRSQSGPRAQDQVHPLGLGHDLPVAAPWTAARVRQASREPRGWIADRMRGPSRQLPVTQRAAVT